MLHTFLTENQVEILAMTETRSLNLAGIRPSSEQLRKGLPIFYAQLIAVLRHDEEAQNHNNMDVDAMATAAGNSDEVGIARASGRIDEIAVAKAGSVHGSELLRLGYTLSHVVHAYGAMCQSITELATTRKLSISSDEFRDLNRCLDIAIAGAVTEFQFLRNVQENNRETEQLGFLAHELRNALNCVNIALQLIKKGTVGFGGSTGQVMDRGLKRMEYLVDRSLTQVRLRVDTQRHFETAVLLHVIDQILVTAEVEALARSQTIEVHIEPSLTIEADQQLVYSALSNVIQNALKYTRTGGRIEIRGFESGANIVVEVEDECGGINDTTVDLFQPFQQNNENREGLGLGLTIARKAIWLNHGTIEVKNLPGKGCIFTIILPREARKD